MEEAARKGLQQRQGFSTPFTPAHGAFMSCVCKLASSLLLDPPADGAGFCQPFLLVKLRAYCCLVDSQPLLQELNVYDVSFCNPLSINKVFFILAAVMQLICLLWRPSACNESCLQQGSSAVPQLTCYTIFSLI